MRHIGFDESTVMREFARIAGNNGMIKSAGMEVTAGVRELVSAVKGLTFENPQAAAKIVESLSNLPLGADLAEAWQFWSSDKSQLGWLPPADLAQVASLISSQATPAPAQATASWGNKIADALESKMPLSGPAMVPFKSAITELRRMGPDMSAIDVKNYVLKRFPGPSATIAGLLGSIKAQASLKVAEEKLYDITDETGEQLVEKAHPGGGTRTELTHSKTDENLVETIVEQQEKDIEVATKVPKGVHTALLNLADKLDKLGFPDAADSVDSIIKSASLKKSANDAADFKQAVSQALANMDGDRMQINHVKNQWDGKSLPTISEGATLVKTLAKQYPKLNLLNVLYPVFSSFSGAIELERAELEYKQFEMQQKRQPAPTGSVQQKELTVKQKRLLVGRNKLRAALGLAPVAAGQDPWGAGFAQAMNKVKGLREWWRANPRTPISKIILKIQELKSTKDFKGEYSKLGPDGEIKDTDVSVVKKPETEADKVSSGYDMELNKATKQLLPIAFKSLSSWAPAYKDVVMSLSVKARREIQRQLGWIIKRVLTALVPKGGAMAGGDKTFSNAAKNEAIKRIETIASKLFSEDRMFKLTKM